MSNDSSHAAMAHAAHGPDAGGSAHSSGNFWFLTLGSVGVVFGDIGTSPLYALQTALSRFRGSPLAPIEIVGVVSLIIWALLIVVTAKYVLFLMQADNKGEGGILSLKALAQSALGKRTLVVFLLGVAGVGAVLGRRNHNARDFSPFGAGGPQAGQRGPCALHPAGDHHHPDFAIHRPAGRHGWSGHLLWPNYGGVLRRHTRLLALSTFRKPG